MKRNALIVASALAAAIVATASGGALAQASDSRDGSRGPFGPRSMWDGDWGMMGRGMLGPGMMGLMSPAMMPMMFVMMDTNGDGAVSFEEMEAVHKRMFDLVDENKDGKVTIEEMREFGIGSRENDE
jgi:hypothetical protein